MLPTLAACAALGGLAPPENAEALCARARATSVVVWREAIQSGDEQVRFDAFPKLAVHASKMLPSAELEIGQDLGYWTQTQAYADDFLAFAEVLSDLLTNMTKGGVAAEKAAGDAVEAFEILRDSAADQAKETAAAIADLKSVREAAVNVSDVLEADYAAAAQKFATDPAAADAVMPVLKIVATSMAQAGEDVMHAHLPTSAGAVPGVHMAIGSSVCVANNRTYVTFRNRLPVFTLASVGDAVANATAAEDALRAFNALAMSGAELLRNSTVFSDEVAGAASVFATQYSYVAALDLLLGRAHDMEAVWEAVEQGLHAATREVNASAVNGTHAAAVGKTLLEDLPSAADAWRTLQARGHVFALAEAAGWGTVGADTSALDSNALPPFGGPSLPPTVPCPPFTTFSPLPLPPQDTTTTMIMIFAIGGAALFVVAALFVALAHVQKKKKERANDVTPPLV
eukprot:TRINITY_DN2654_c2_g1_i1.p1 TRINITY_DN2654_c2_g1~~TRINITY_DN2654_c2_g1_i1.p1  ORF type:complete len:457 (+),score=124.74 TRINITY_DN2654_c2_g1_i1:58-1428(+)